MFHSWFSLHSPGSPPVTGRNHPARPFNRIFFASKGVAIGEKGFHQTGDRVITELSLLITTKLNYHQTSHQTDSEMRSPNLATSGLSWRCAVLCGNARVALVIHTNLGPQVKRVPS